MAWHVFTWVSAHELRPGQNTMDRKYHVQTRAIHASGWSKCLPSSNQS